MTSRTSRDFVLTQLKDIIQSVIDGEQVSVYLFGSWAREEEKQSSDIDIALEAIHPISALKWLDLQEQVAESTIPYKVEIVNLADASTELIENVKKEGILWIGCNNN